MLIAEAEARAATEKQMQEEQLNLTRHKVERLRKIMEERRAKREARRQAAAAGRSGEQAAKREIYFQVWSRNVNLQTGNISFEARDLLPGIGCGLGPGKRGFKMSK